MALVSTSIPNLLNGVSQQPSSLRQVTQGETQENALSSVIDGLVKRPPTEHIAKIMDGDSLQNSAVHIADRGDGNKHAIIVNANTTQASVEIYDLTTGNAVSSSNSLTDNSYLYCSSPADDLKFLTVNNYTIIVNTKKTVAMDSATSTGTLNATKYNDFSDLPDGYATSAGGTGIATLNNIYEVTGSDSNNFDTYYVKCVSVGAGTTTYEETRKNGVKTNLDSHTMPIQLQYLASYGSGVTYDINEISWEYRTVGDADSAPEPSFVGSEISNVFFFKNRLGFLSGQNVILSAAGDHFRFFPKTVTTVLADAPIDVSVTYNKPAQLKQAVTFNDSITLFSDNTQFKIENAGNLSPQTISIIPSTEFENDASVTPVGAGNLLYFVSKKGDYSSVREYFVEEEAVITDAMDITAHVPKYIPKNVRKIATSSNEDTLVILPKDSGERHKLYVYKWFTDGREKLQSSWSVWDIGRTIYDIELIESELYLVTQGHQSNSQDGVMLEKIDLQYLDDTGLDFCVRLDRKVTLTGNYDSATDLTTWTLPYQQTGDITVVKGGLNWTRKGANITTVSPKPSLTEVTASGDYSAYPCILGIPYTMNYEFSTQHIKEKGGTQSVQSGRLQLRTMRVNFEDTGFFKIQVTPQARQTYEYEYTGVTLNQAGSTIGDVVLNDGTFRFPIQAKNDLVSIKILSDSYLPCAFQNAEWEGFYNIRSKRI